MVQKDTSESRTYWSDDQDQTPEEFEAMIKQMKKQQQEQKKEKPKPDDEEIPHSELRLF